MLGLWEVVGQTVFFKPRFPFLPDREHVASFHGPRLAELAGLPADIQGQSLLFHFKPPPAIRGPAPQVQRVHPVGEQLPANILRLYIHFSQPMRRGMAYAGIRVLDVSGVEVPRPFVIVPEELWNPQGTRLTVLFDPGRIKRGLDPHIQDGAPLQQGGSYTLVVSGREDARGNPQLVPFVKRFTVVKADRASPDPGSWQLKTVSLGTSDPLVVETGECLDHPLLARSLQIISLSGQILAGKVTVNNRADSWRFTPEKPWSAGTYQLRVLPELEDLAGNRIYRLFDETRDPTPQPAERIITFRIQ